MASCPTDRSSLDALSGFATRRRVRGAERVARAENGGSHMVRPMALTTHPEDVDSMRRPLLARRLIIRSEGMTRRLTSLMAALVALLAPDVVMAQRLPSPEVEEPPYAVVEEEGESPVYYRLPDDSVTYAGRFAVGFAVPWATGEDKKVRFSVDAYMGAAGRASRTDPFGFLAEIGYSYVHGTQHWLVGGIGPAWLRAGPRAFEERPSGPYGFALVPHALVGEVDGRFAYGGRLSLLASWYFVGVEVAYQAAHVDGREGLRHEMQLKFTPNYMMGMDL